MAARIWSDVNPETSMLCVWYCTSLIFAAQRKRRERPLSAAGRSGRPFAEVERLGTAGVQA
jgi:hypothetical protein